MTCISHRHRFAYVHIYKAEGTAVSELLLAHARLCERVARHSGGRKIFYVVNIAQEKASRGRLPKGSSSWYMGLEKHASLSAAVAYLGPSRRDYRLFSVIRELLFWVKIQYNYISMWPPHAQHKVVSAQSLTDYAEDFIALGRGLQSQKLRPAPLPGRGSRAIDAVFMLESLATDTRPLRSLPGLPEAEDEALTRRNQSNARGTCGALPVSLRTELAQYLAPDIALQDAAVAAGGALLATPSRPVPVAGT
jgi:hypothetical protein